jgi:magnesium transporter
MADSERTSSVDEEKRPSGTAPAAERDPSEEVANRLDDLPAPDGAAVMRNLSNEKAADVAEYLDPNTAGDILSEMDPGRAATVIARMEPEEASMVLSAMDPDDRVDVLQRLPKELHDRLVGEMPADDVAEVHSLEQYPQDTAGGIMTTEVTSLQEYFSVEEAVAELRRLSEQLEQMFYVYVVDARKHLVGVLSMRDLILARPERKLREIMRPDVYAVPATMDQEEVARRMRRYGYLALPVVDDKHRLVGLITVDDVVDVIEEEATEDIHKMFGAGVEERLSSPWYYSYRTRVVWLIVNLGTAFLAAGVVAGFQETIAALPILAAYQTIVSGMGGNASAQAMAVAIRGIALGEVDRSMLHRILRREAIVGLLSGVTVGIATWAVAATFHRAEHGAALGLVIFLALIFNHVNACVTGVSVPFIMKRLGFDPAQSASIIATTFTDCGGFFATLGLAKLLMRFIA